MFVMVTLDRVHHSTTLSNIDISLCDVCIKQRSLICLNALSKYSASPLISIYGVYLLDQYASPTNFVHVMYLETINCCISS